MHKAGFVNIIGNPNVGKSTLLNLLLGEKLAITSPKSQTTRHRIKGILNSDNYQIVFSDTPGILTPKYNLQKIMLRTVMYSLSDADIILYMTDVTDKLIKNEPLIDKIRKIRIPVFLIINKIDLLQSPKTLNTEITKWENILPNAYIFPVSCKKKFNVDNLLAKMMDLLPVHPPYFAKDANELSDSPLRFFLAEIIREKIFLTYRQEIPYATNVVITSYKVDKTLVRIAAEIFVERDSQKAILIGGKGLALRKIGTLARKDMENFIHKKVFLQLYVKVEKDWRNKLKSLKKFGFS